MSPRAGRRFFVSAIACTSSHCATSRGLDCHYRIAWTINPHMRIGATRPERARSQLAHFRRTLQRLGAQVIELPFVHGAYDCVFAKDNAILTDGAHGPRALLAHPRTSERQAEQRERRRALEAHGFDVSTSPRFLEGGDVVVLPRLAGALFGHGFRSDPKAADALAAHLERPVQPLRLIDERLYHLDMALSVLSDGTALVCREAFDAPSLARLEHVDGIERIVPVPIGEALTFALNLVEVGDHVLLDSAAPTVRRLLQAMGKTVLRVDLSEFRLAGGSAACLTAAVHQHAPRVAIAVGPGGGDALAADGGL